MPDPVIIENRPRRAWVFVALWAVETLAGLGFAGSGLAWLGARENGAGIVLIVMGLVLCLAGIVMTGQSWRIARLHGPAIRMTASGLTDRRVAEQEVPWEALHWKIVFNGRSYAVQFGVAEPHRATFRPHWEQRLQAGFHRLFGYPDFVMPLLGTAHSVAALAEHLRKFKAES